MSDTINGQRLSRHADRQYVFYFFSIAHFLKTILVHRTNGTFANPHKATHNPSFAKEAFFAKARQNQLNAINKM